MTFPILRAGWRLLWGRPALGAARVGTVALVVMAVAIVWAIVSATILRRLPYPAADRLIRIGLLAPGSRADAGPGTLFPIAFARLRDHARAVDTEGSWLEDHAVVTGGAPETLTGVRVTAGYFRQLAGTAAAGRVFTEAEAAEGAMVVVIGHGYWRRAFNGDPAAIGQTLVINRRAHEIVGILAATFEPPFGRPDIFLPLEHRRHDTLRATAVQAFGALRAGASIDDAVAEVDAILKATQREVPDLMQGYRVRVVDLRESLYGTRRPALVVVAISVMALALVAIANLTNLSLADLVARRGEFALRAALGGRARHLAAPDGAQCLIAGAIGAAAGLAGASTLVPAMVALDSSGAFVPDTLTIDWRVILAGCAAAAVVMTISVMIPVLRSLRPRMTNLVSAAASRSTPGRRARRVTLALVGAQVAGTLILLSSAALITGGWLRTSRIAPGFDADRVVTAQLRLSVETFPDVADRARFIAQVLDRLRATPGIVSAGTTLNPFRDGGGFTTNVSVEGRPSPDGTPYTMLYRRVSDGYFETLRIRLVSGRLFAARDDLDGAPVAIVSDSFARQMWPGETALGRRVRRGISTSPALTVVGVVEDVRDAGLAQAPGPTLYTPYRQGNSPAAPVALVVRTTAASSSFVPAIKQAVWSVDPMQPLSNVVLLQDYLAAGLGPQRFRALLVSLSGGFSLLLALIGTFAVTARSVSERTREIGIRIAIGGDPSAVWRVMAAGGVFAVTAGALIGLALSAAVDRSIAQALGDLGTMQWWYRGSAAVVLLLVGSGAALLAARRAMTIDPRRAMATD